MKKINFKQWMIALLSFSIFFSSCNDDDDKKIIGAFEDGVFISNEGNMSTGDGSVSYYNYDQDTVYNNIFESVNQRQLGSVVQSVTVHEGNAYIAVNASNKVEIVKASTFEEIGVITDVSSPRYFLGIDKNKGYISQWGDNGAIKVIDLSTFAITKTIVTSAGPEQMLLHNDLVYVANSGGYNNNNTVSVIDPSNDEVIKTITLDGDSPRDFVVDANNDIWVICAGFVDWYAVPMTETPSKLIKINPTTNEIISTITISENAHPTCLETSRNGNNLFYGGGYGFQGIYKMSITDTEVPTSALINKVFYGFNINPETGNIFALEAASDYVSKGKLYRYEANGTMLGEYEVGVGPNGANFKKK